jgi:hypothetical protein
MSKPYPCFCADCKWSRNEKDSEHFIRCFHPKVNAKDPYSLGAGKGIKHGVCCREERTPHWLYPDACGIKGKLWEAK